MSLPAHETKHLTTLSYPIGDATFELNQRDDGESNGTALWLGAQVLSVFLADVLRPVKTENPSIKTASKEAEDIPSNSDIQGGTPTRTIPRAIELGSGIGLSALALASMGWSVVATDTATVIESVLRENIKRNTYALRQSLCKGDIQVRELDWTVLPEVWRWDDNEVIASHKEREHTGNGDNLDPPSFDLIFTSDTLYSPTLITPLLRTLYHLCSISLATVVGKNDYCQTQKSPKPPPIYVCVENRDPQLVSSFFAEAKDVWKFTVTRIPHRRVQRTMDRSKLPWKRSDWEGVEIWKLTFSNTD